MVERIKNYLWLLFLMPSYALASNAVIEDPLGEPATDAGQITEIVLRIQGIAWAAAGAIAVIMIIWGGVIFMTAGGNEEKVAKGKKVLTYAIGGLVLILLSYFLVKGFISLLGGNTAEITPTP